MKQSIPDIRLDSPFGSHTLRRWPRRAGERLRAWDNADSLALAALAERGAQRLLVVNDSHGALSLPVGDALLGSTGDSWLSRRAIADNARDNTQENAQDNAPSWDEERHWLWPDQPLPAEADLVMMRVPKSLSLFEYQLYCLNRDLPAGVPVLVAGMDKHLPDNLRPLMEHWLDEVNVGRGERKARLFSGITRGETTAVTKWPKTLTLAEQGWQLTIHAGVFSGARQDPGGRFLMRHVPEGVEGMIADLGCGNGMVGLLAAQRNPGARVIFCDESYQAIRSVRESAARCLPGGDVGFHLGNGLDRLDDTFDLILLNPPFHRGHAIDDGTARMLFSHAKRQLKPGGELRVVGNRHLDYKRILGRQFGWVKQLAADNRFVVLAAGK